MIDARDYDIGSSISGSHMRDRPPPIATYDSLPVPTARGP